MALLKGRFIDPSEAIKLNSDPVASEDVARKGYVDTANQAIQSQVDNLGNLIDTETQDRAAGDFAEQQARQAGDQALQQQVDNLSNMWDTEMQERAAYDNSLQNQINTEKGRVDAILSASTADKDSFAEIVQLINSVDTQNDSAFASYVLSNNAALAAEQAARQSGDQALQSQVENLGNLIDTELQDRAAGDFAEQQARQAADQVLQSQVENLENMWDTEMQSRAAGDFAEETARKAADSALDVRVTALETAPQVQGQKVGFNLTAEDVANGYVEFSGEPMPMTMIVVVSGIVHSEEEDYTISTSEGVTRISFVGDLAAKLQEGDKVRIQFLKRTPAVA